MSAKTRQDAEKLRKKYARNFRVELDDVQVKEFINKDNREDAEIFAPGHGLPVWTVGA